MKGTVPYDQALKRGVRILSEINEKHRELGDLAYAVEPRFGSCTMENFTRDLAEHMQDARDCVEVRPFKQP